MTLEHKVDSILSGRIAVFVLFGLALLLVLDHRLAHVLLNDSVNTETIVNAAGMRRALSQRAALLAHLGRAGAGASLAEEFNALEARFFALEDQLTGASGETGAMLPASLIGDLQDLNSAHRAYFAALRRGMTDPSMPLPGAEKTRQVLRELDQIVTAYEVFAREKHRGLTRFIWPSALLQASLLAGIAVLFQRKVVRADERRHGALRSRANQYMRYYDKSPFLQYDLDRQGRFVRVNQTMADMLGVSKDGLLGAPVFDYLVGGEEIKQGFEFASYKAGVEPKYRFYKSIDGRHVPVVLHASRAPGLHEQDVLSVLGFDLSEEENAHRSASQVEMRLSRSFEESPIPMFSANADGSLVKVNRQLLQCLGANSIDDFSEHELPAHIAVAIEDILSGASHGTCSSKVSLADKYGNALDALLFVRVHETSDESVGIVEGGFIDITELEALRRVIQQSRARFQRLYDATPIALCSVDSAAKIADINNFAVRVFGAERSELIGDGLERIFVADDLEAASRQVQECLANSQTLSFDANCHRAHGATFPARVFLNRDGALQDERAIVLMTILDCSEIAAAESERDQIADRLRMAEKMEAVGQLSAGIAHEINTPTQYVSDNLEFLKTSSEELLAKVAAIKSTHGLDDSIDLDFYLAELPAAISESLEGMTQIREIVRAMKDFSHPGEKERTSVDLNRLLESVVTVTRNEWKYVADLALDLDSELQDVECDAPSINQVLLNIIVNAAHAMEEKYQDQGGPGTLKIATRQDPGRVEISVEDSGAGIPPSHIKKVFNPFFTTKEVGKGTGQGLAIAYRIVVEEHGGQIDVRSQPGEWTRFTITLPNKAVEVAA